MTPDAETLAQRLAAGRLPLNDAMRFAAHLIDALRNAHEEGESHGALTPDAIILKSSAVELLPPQPGAIEALTPYTAPERLKGLPPDTRSDIFACGAILYEMFAGHRAFSAEEPQALATDLENSMPAPLGDAGLDRLIFNCLAKDPAARWQRAQQLQLEIKILGFSGRSRSASALRAAAPPPPPPVDLKPLETRLTARLELQEQAMAVLQDSVATLVSHSDQPRPEVLGLQQTVAQLPDLAARLDRHDEMLAAFHRTAGEFSQLETRLTVGMQQCDDALSGVKQLSADLPGLDSRLTTRLEQQERALAALRDVVAENTSMLQFAGEKAIAMEEQLNAVQAQLTASRERAEQAQQTAAQAAEEGHREAATLQVSLAGELHAIEQTVKTHGAAIESIRGAMARTDDFMERVVEALESLQTMVLERAQVTTN